MVAAISAGFGAVFGVPLAGAVFGLEVQRRTGEHLNAVLPCLIASLTGSAIVNWLGITHTLTPDLGHVELSFVVLMKVTLAAVAFWAGGHGFFGVRSRHQMGICSIDSLVSGPTVCWRVDRGCTERVVASADLQRSVYRID